MWFRFVTGKNYIPNALCLTTKTVKYFVHVKIWCLHSWFQSCSHLCTVLHLYINSWFSSLTSQQLFIAYVVEILPSVLWCCWLGGRKGIRPVKKTEWWGSGVVICLEQGADLHMAQLIPPPLTVSCFSKIQIGFTFLVPAHPGSPGQRAVKRVCVYRLTRVVPEKGH